MVLADSRRIPRVPRYSGTRFESAWLSLTWLSHSSARSFQTASASQRIGNSTVAGPTTPSPARSARRASFLRRTPCSAGFGLFRFRSPLLSESRLLSFPPGTEMVHFPGFASAAYGFSGRFPRFTRVGFPIRRSPDLGLLASPRGLSQLATSFIACLRQGIHRTPLVA